MDENDRYRLMDMIDRNGNRDGAALRFVAEHLAKRPENRKLLILISDGQPADTGYRGTEAEADLRGNQEGIRQTEYCSVCGSHWRGQGCHPAHLSGRVPGHYPSG